MHTLVLAQDNFPDITVEPCGRLHPLASFISVSEARGSTRAGVAWVQRTDEQGQELAEKVLRRCECMGSGSLGLVFVILGAQGLMVT